jgi:hypothetical protein
MQLLGCSIHEFKQWIEPQFKRGMTWRNYGKKWHIDHIVPCSWFNLSDRDEQRRCFHYTNLRPLSKRANLARGAARGEQIQTKLLLSFKKENPVSERVERQNLPRNAEMEKKLRFCR